MKQIEVNILGQVYMLACPEGGEALLASAVGAVDQEMTAIRDAGKVRSRERIAVLAALNLAYLLAERGPAPAPAAPAAAASRAENEGDATAAATIAALLGRVERALADDGQLL